MFMKVVLIALQVLINLQVIYGVTCSFEIENEVYTCRIRDQNIQSNAEMQSIEGVHLAELTNNDVKRLDQSKSTIQVFPSLIINKFVNLKTVMLNSTDMMSFETPMTDCGNLEFISLDYNKIKAIPEGIFQNCDKLSYLSISQNEIIEIHDKAFVGLAELQTLRLSTNKIKKISREILSPLSNLNELSVDSNEIEETSSETLQTLPKLFHLALSNNKISTWNSEITQHNQLIQFLYLHDNQIESITTETFANLPELKALTVGNLIKELPVFPNLRKLIFLSLDGNKLTKITMEPFEKLSILEQLYLRENQIEFVNFELKTSGIWSKLLLLALDQNKIKNIDENSFVDLKQLTVLSLQGNQLQKLEEKVFRPTFPLQSFDVRDNKIEEIDRKLFSGILNMKFYASGNVCFNEDVKVDQDFNMEKLKDCFNSSVVRKVNLMLIWFIAALMLFKNI